MKVKFTDFINGIVSLIISQILIKIFGIIYTLYITNKNGFGDQGNAIYMSGYQIYALLLTVSSIGVPNAISKIISEKKSIKDYINADRIFNISIFLFAIIGFIGCMCLYFSSEYIAEKILEIPEAKLSLMVLSPAIFFVSINSVVKGYFNGENKIYVTAKTQFFEQVLKSIFTIVFVEIFSKISNNNTEIMAAVANLATTVATLCSLIYIICKYIKSKKLEINGIIYQKERIIHIVRKVLAISIPITLSAIISSLGKNVDSITVVRILKRIIGEEQAIIKYGILSSKVDILIALPLAFNMSIATALIPEISIKKARNDINGIMEKIKFSLLITFIIGIPYTFGVYNYAKEILALLFPNANAGNQLLKIASIGIIFSMLTQTINGILQGLGKNKIPLYASIIGLIIKIFSNIVLIPLDGILEKGAVIGNVISSMVSFIIVYIMLKKNINLDFSIFKITIKPIFGSMVMIIISFLCYKILIRNNLYFNFCIIITIGIAVIIYILSIILMKMIKIDSISERLEKSGF